MTKEERSTQIKVGIFLLIGLTTIAMLVVYFGRFGEGVRNCYTLRAEFPNASGLMRDAYVTLAGARIGRVANDPIILPDMEGVYVDLRVFDDVKIPSASQFTIGSSGLLGDKFVQIDLKPGARESVPIAPGTTIKGVTGGGGLGGMTEDAGALMAELRTTVGNINSVVKKLDTGLLNDEGVASLKETLKNLQTTSTSLAAASAKVDNVITQADTAIQSGKGTMDSAKKAADELQRALADIRGLIREIRQGQGALGTLISNRETADNLRSLVSNLRRYGILWYRDGDKAKAPGPGR
ncbi:MAG: MlaD family protein [Verrucomicrobiae bacterium]